MRGENVAIQGWERDSGVKILELLARYEDGGAEAVVVTQIAHDGMGVGPDVGGLSEVLAATSLKVIASGGVGSLQHIADLVRLRVEGKALAGVVVGKAIHDGTIGVPAALETIREL